MAVIQTPLGVVDKENFKFTLDSHGNVAVNTLGYTPTYDLMLDDYSTANVMYIGEALIGSPTSSALWRIKKIDETTGLVLTWAGGNASFDKIWDNRLTLTYN